MGRGNDHRGRRVEMKQGAENERGKEDKQGRGKEREQETGQECVWSSGS